MSSPEKAAATVQNDILLVQYSPTGIGPGDLYAILLSNMNQPLPFQIQRQAPDLQASNIPIGIMSLATIPSSADTSPTTPGTGPPVPPSSSPGGVNGNGTSPVVAAPPFLDVVLAMSDIRTMTYDPQVWHMKAPGRGTPPGTTPSQSLAPYWGASMIPSSYFPGAATITVGTFTPRGTQKPGILAVMNLGGALHLTKLEYPPGSVNLGSSRSSSTQAPSSSPNGSGDGGNSDNAASEQPVAWIRSWDHTMVNVRNVFRDANQYVTTVPASAFGGGGYSVAAVAKCHIGNLWCTNFTEDPPSNSALRAMSRNKELPESQCITSTSKEMVSVFGHEVRIRNFDVNDVWDAWQNVTVTNAIPKFKGPTIACATVKNFVIAISPDSSGGRSKPEIHLFNLNTGSWTKAQLVQAPPGTFSDLPIPPSPDSPSKGGSGEGGAGQGGAGGGGSGGGGPGSPSSPSTENPSSVNTSNSSAALIGGIVGGIVILGALIFAGFFFRRRRSSKTKTHNQSAVSPEPLDGDDDLREKRRMHYRERRGHGDDRNPQAIDRQEKPWPGTSIHPEVAFSQAHISPEKPRRQVNHPQEMAWPPSSNYQDAALSPMNGRHQMGWPGSNNFQEVAWSRANNHGEMGWSPSNDYQEGAWSRAKDFHKMGWPPAGDHHEIALSQVDRPRKTSQSRVNNPQEVAQGMVVPVMHRIHNPQFNPNNSSR